jgi:hypothetical protein
MMNYGSECIAIITHDGYDGTTTWGSSEHHDLLGFFFSTKEELIFNPLAKPNRLQRRMMQNFISIELYGGCAFSLSILTFKKATPFPFL